jgi:RNA polymerase sigma factor (sigma-70 family)
MSSDTGRALVDVLEANRAQLRFIARSVLYSSELVDDVMQDAYLRLSSVSTEVRSPLTYCRQVVRNLALDHCRHRAVEQACIAADVSVDWLEAPSSTSPQRRMENREILMLLDKVLDRVSAKARTVFELHRIEGHTQREVGQRLGYSLTYVNLLYSEALRAVETLVLDAIWEA